MRFATYLSLAVAFATAAILAVFAGQPQLAIVPMLISLIAIFQPRAHDKQPQSSRSIGLQPRRIRLQGYVIAGCVCALVVVIAAPFVPLPFPDCAPEVTACIIRDAPWLMEISLAIVLAATNATVALISGFIAGHKHLVVDIGGLLVGSAFTFFCVQILLLNSFGPMK